MFSLLPKLDFSETVNTLLSYLVVVSLSLTVVIFGMRLERHIMGNQCQNRSELIIEGQVYECSKKDE